MIERIGFRRLAAVVAPLAVLAALAAPHGARVLADAPIGTLTVNDGSAYTNSRTVTLHAPATGAVSVQFFLNGSPISATLPYTDVFVTTIPADELSYWFSVQWTAADDTTSAVGAGVTLDTTPPAIASLFTPQDSFAIPGVRLIGLDGNHALVNAVAFSPNGSSWSPAIPVDEVYSNQLVVPYHLFDQALGGSPVLGARTVWVKERDEAGNWSNVKSQALDVSVSTGINVVPAHPVTGQKVTFTPDYAGPVTFPAGTHCYWEFSWGDDQSLYGNSHDETWGFFYTYGPKSGGYCGARSFTMPWIPYPSLLAHFRAEASDGEPLVEAWIDSSPGHPAVVPVVESTDRHITYSNVPMVYILPDDYTLALGQPTTYRAYSLNGAPITDSDLWSVDYIDYPEQHFGGTSLTFTPKQTGYITVSWGTDSTKNTRFAASYDPRVRRPDHTAPVATAPAQHLTTASVTGATVPVAVTWTGSDVGWGIAKYQVERSIDGGAWKRILGAKVKSLAQALAPGHGYRYRVRAVDKAGNVGAWRTGPSFRPRVVEDGAASVVYAGDFAAVVDAAARGGSLHEAVTAASSATFTFTGRDVAWIAERGPGHGTASVYLGATKVATVNLEATVDAPARVVFRQHWATSGAHTIRIVVDGTVGHPTVDVDGFIVLR